MTVAAIKIREATHQDHDAIRQMIFDVLKEYNVAADPLGDDSDATEFGLNADRVYLVADIDGQPGGSAILTEVAAGTFKLSKLFLPKKHRGKGIGRKLLDASVAHVRKAKGKEIYLRTRDSYREAIRLYDRSGWIRHPEEVAPPGPPVKYSMIFTHEE